MVHRGCALKLLPLIAMGLAEKRVVLKADPESFSILESLGDKILLEHASDDDFATEFLDNIMAIKIVDSFDNAVSHINVHGSKHTELIITEDKELAERFMNIVDAAGVYWNASTRFADGFRYGFGAEIGVCFIYSHIA